MPDQSSIPASIAPVNPSSSGVETNNTPSGGVDNSQHSLMNEGIDIVKSEIEAEAGVKGPTEAAESDRAEAGKEGKLTDEELSAIPETAEAYVLPAMPGGMELDIELSDRFKIEAKEMGLNQGQYQRLVNKYATELTHDPQKYAEDQVAQVMKLDAQWKAELSQSPTFKEDLSFAQKALALYGEPDLLEFFDATRTGSYPPMFRLMAKIGRDVAEPLIRGKASNGGHEAPLHERIWGAK